MQRTPLLNGRITVAVVIALACYAIIFPFLRPILSWQTSDFTAYYRAGQMVANGQGAAIYDYDAAKHYSPKWSAKLEAVHEKLALKRFVSAPFVLLIFAPLSYLSHYHAELVWYAINVCLMVAWPLLLHRILGRGKLLVFALLAPLLFIPVIVAMIQGQTSILMLFLFALAYLGLREGQDVRAGLLFALAGIKPQFVLPVLLMLIVARKWRAVAAFLSTTVALLGVSAALAGWRTALSYPAAWVRYNVLPRETGGAHVEGIPNIRGMLYVWLHGHVSTAALVTLTLAASAILLALIGVAVKREREISDLAFSFGIVGTLLVSYYCYLFDLSLLTLAFVLMLGYVRDHNHSPLRIPLYVTLGIFYLLPFFSAGLERMIIYLFFVMVLFATELWIEIVSQPQAHAAGDTAISLAQPVTG